MNNNLLNFIENHKKLKYILRCMKHFNNEMFVNEVLDIGINPMSLRYESIGSLYPNKVFYLIENSYQANSRMGFFAEYRRLLDGLLYADKLGFTPFILFNENFLYAEKHSINGTKNPFEYYFKQTTKMKLDEIAIENSIVKFENVHRHLANTIISKGDGYCVTNDYIELLAKVARKYIKLNSFTDKYINNCINQILNHKKTLAVHVRGTDFYMAPSGHPIPVDAHEYIKYVKTAMRKYDYQQVFLATDDNTIIRLFKDEFKGKLVYYDDVYRMNEKGKGVHLTVDNRNNHHYLLGLEVLRDMMTLVYCEGLVAGLSQVSICARITKKSMDMHYEYIKIIDKGIHNKSWENRRKK